MLYSVGSTLSCKAHTEKSCQNIKSSATEVLQKHCFYPPSDVWVMNE